MCNRISNRNDRNQFFFASFAVGQIRQNKTLQHDVGVDEHLNALLPLDASFNDESGNRYTLSKFIAKDRPTILTLNYSNCPMLCNLQLSGLVQAMTKPEFKLDPGKDFELVSISIDPRELPSKARETKQKYLDLAGRDGFKDSWHFLTGKQIDIERVAEAIGFRYEYDPRTKEYYHAPVFVIVSSEGRIMRYVHACRLIPMNFRQP